MIKNGDVVAESKRAAKFMIYKQVKSVYKNKHGSFVMPSPSEMTASEFQNENDESLIDDVESGVSIQIKGYLESDGKNVTVNVFDARKRAKDKEFVLLTPIDHNSPWELSYT